MNDPSTSDWASEWDDVQEWYALRLRSGLPAEIARAAHDLHLTPSEFIAQAAEHELQRMHAITRRAPVAARRAAAETRPHVRMPL